MLQAEVLENEKAREPVKVAALFRNFNF